MKKTGAQAFSFLHQARPLTLREVLKLRDGMNIDRRFPEKRAFSGLFFLHAVGGLPGQRRRDFIFELSSSHRAAASPQPQSNLDWDFP